MATTAAVVAAGATVAAAGAQAAGAASSGKGGGGAPSLPETPLWERIFNRGTADLLDEERRVMEDALAQANFLQPEMYKLLGFEPVYDTQQAADVGALSQKFEQLQQAQFDNRERTFAIGQELADLRRDKSLSPKERRLRMKELRKERKQLKQDNPRLVKELGLAQRELGDAQAVPRRVVGFKKLDRPADPTQSKGDLFRMALDLQNQTLVNALEGKEPIDATLRTAWDEKERALRERLRRTLGPDYETSSAGIEAIANFDRERSQSFEQYNREVIGQFSQLTESRAIALSNLTGAALQQMLFPANAQMQRGLLLGQAAGDRLAFVRSQREDRGQKLEASKARFEAEAANNAARGQAIAAIGGALGTVGQGAAGFGTSSYAQSFGGGGASTYTPAAGGGGSATLDYGAEINRYLGR